MVIAFCISQYEKLNIGLQPWLTINKIALRLDYLGHEVHIVTDVGESYKSDRVSVHRVTNLRGTNLKEIERLFELIQADHIIISVTPLSLVTACWYRKIRNCKIYAYLSYPFYSKHEYFRAFNQLDKSDKWVYGRHQLVPQFLWREVMVRFFDGVICQSQRTSTRISSSVKQRIPVHTIPPGIDQLVWNADAIEEKIPSSDTVLLYIGSTKRIRGFRLLLDAISMLSESAIKLRIMARGADEDIVRKIRMEAGSLQLGQNLDVRGGWLESTELRKEIQSADVVLLPFVLVPSELPVSVMEAVCCGTPVIVSDLDGLPEAAGPAGIVIKNGDIHGLSQAIKKIHEHKHILSELRNGCKEQIRNMKSWDDVALMWQDVLFRVS